MTEPELQSLLDQYPGWIAIERLVSRIRALEGEVRQWKQEYARLIMSENGA